MSIPLHFNSAEIQKKWYQYWQHHQLFQPSIDNKKEPYSIIMPPPNITGQLHMGHVLNLTVQDVLLRRARMEGKNVYWVPGLDHASIATETKVIEALKKKGLTKEAVGRSKFLEEAWEWKEKYGQIILQQMKELGVACDWDYTPFTLDSLPSKSVTTAFLTLYERGLIYRGERVIHWDPVSQTALSDEEVNYVEQEGWFYYIDYRLTDSDERLTVATTRPETILADSALAVHPEDKRYQKYVGREVKVPLTSRTIPVIQESYVDKTIGTGVLKITPAHDPNDYKIGKKHQLPTINLLSKNGKLNQNAGVYEGYDRFEARELIAKALKKAGALSKKKKHLHQIGLSERTQAVIEPRISTQWFVKMKALTSPALESVEKGVVQFHPKKFVNTYRRWLEEIKDWCISRQLWWGHRIPAYYLPDQRYVVAKTFKEALQKAKKLDPAICENQLTQDPDVLDTWFSSWLWPITVFDGIENPDNPKNNYYYPTADLVTGADILFFWVARMIMAGYTFTGKAPFRHVYFTGIVRDKERRKMSKSLGNSPDTLALINQYGADGVRAGILLAAPAGNDLLFDEKLCEQGAQFSQKLWNILRLLKSLAPAKEQLFQPIEKVAFYWFSQKIERTKKELITDFEHYRLAPALMSLYKLVWDDFSGHYLEMIKPVAGGSLSQKSYEQACSFFEMILQLLHPFMPFITEEIWHKIKKREESETLFSTPLPQPSSDQEGDWLVAAANAFELIQKIRHYEVDYQLGELLTVGPTLPAWLKAFSPYLKKKTALKKISTKKNKSTHTFLLANTTFSLFLKKKENREENLANIKEELRRKESLMLTITKKLTNADFLKRAPKSIIEREQKKQRDTKHHLEILKQELANRSSS